MGDRHVLIVSPIPLEKAIYLVGAYTNHRFRPEARGVIDYGGHYYAPQSMCDETGRRLIWGWLWEGRSEQARREAGWAGVMSLPRVLTPGADGLLNQAVPHELKALRGEPGRN